LKYDVFTIHLTQQNRCMHIVVCVLWETSGNTAAHITSLQQYNNTT